jgi:hypothetical protein
VNISVEFQTMAAGVGHGLREVHKLQVSEKNVVREIFGSKTGGINAQMRILHK